MMAYKASVQSPGVFLLCHPKGWIPQHDNGSGKNDQDSHNDDDNDMVMTMMMTRIMMSDDRVSPKQQLCTAQVR